MKADLPPHAHDTALQTQILQARQRSLAWYAGLQAPGQPRGVLRISAAHDPAQWPGMLLPGTYNAIMGQGLIGGLGSLDAAARQTLTHWLLAHRPRFQPATYFPILGRSRVPHFSQGV